MRQNSTLLEGAPWAFVLALAAFLVFGCASCENNKGTDPNSGASETCYYPLDVGNKWVYDDTTRNIEITGRQEIGGKEYFVVHCGDLFPNRYVHYYRISKTDSVDALYSYENDYEHLRYDFSAPVGKSWKYHYGGTEGPYVHVTVESKSDTVEVPAGRFVDCVCFSFSLAATGMWAEWLAPNVGIVKVVWNIGRPIIPMPTAELAIFSKGQ